MQTNEYAAALMPILATRSDAAAEALSRLAAAVTGGTVGQPYSGDGPAGSADAIVVNVFVDDDGEGPFDVWARFEGGDAFRLDRRFDEVRHLFGVEWGELGWEPDVPGRPRGWSRDELQTVIVAVVAGWLRPLIPAGSEGLAWRIETPDGLESGDLG